MGPFDPSILGKVPLQGLPSFRESYRFGITLRDLADQRRVREQQYRMNELEMQQRQRELAHAQQEWDATQRIIGGFSSGELNENSTLAQLASKGNLGAALKVNQAIQQQLNAKRTADKAAMDLAGAKRKEQTEKEKTLADVLYGIRNIQDPAQRQARMDELAMQDLMKPEAQRLGTGSMLGQLQREGEPTPLAEPEFQRRYSVAYTPKETQALLSAEATRKEAADRAALELAGKQREDAARFAYSVNDQAGYEELLKMLPAEDRARYPQKISNIALRDIQRRGMTSQQLAQLGQLDSPGKIIAWMQDPNLTPEERAQRAPLGQTMLEQSAGYQVAAHPPQTPASLQLLPPEVYNQQVQKARDIAAIKPGATAGQFKTKMLSVKNLEDAITAYENELKTTGPTVLPAKGAKLKATFTDLQMKTKALFELGVITGPDMQILQGAITDPTTIRGSMMLGKDALMEQLGVLRSAAERSKNNLKEVYGQSEGEAPKPSTPSAAPPSTARTGIPKTAAEAQAAGYVSVKDATGKTHWFPNKAEADAFKKRTGVL